MAKKPHLFQIDPPLHIKEGHQKGVKDTAATAETASWHVSPTSNMIIRQGCGPVKNWVHDCLSLEGLLWMDEIHFAPPKKIWFLMICLYILTNLMVPHGVLGGAKWISQPTTVSFAKQRPGRPRGSPAVE